MKCNTSKESQPNEEETQTERKRYGTGPAGLT